MPVISKTNPVNWGHPLNRGRVAWWKCLDGMGTGYQWRDLAGLNHLTLSSGAKPSSNKGYSGATGSIIFDGTDDYASCPDHPRFNITSQITVSASVYRTGGSGTDYHIVMKQAATTWTSPFAVWAMRISSGNKLVGWVTNPGSYFIVGSTTLSTSAWYRLVMTYDGATLRGYINGVQDVSASYAVAISTSTQPVLLGARSALATDFFGGLIDNVSVHNRALSAGEVAQDYNLSRLGYPGVLNRLSNKVYFILASGLAANPLRGGGAASNPIWGYIG